MLIKIDEFLITYVIIYMITHLSKLKYKHVARNVVDDEKYSEFKHFWWVFLEM